MPCCKRPLARYAPVLIAGLLLFLWSAEDLTGAEQKKTDRATVEQMYPGLASGVLKSASLATMPNGILLKTDGIEIEEALIKGALEVVEPKLRRQLEKNLFNMLEQEATKKMLLREARTSGLGTEGLPDAEALQVHLDRVAQRAGVSERDVRAFYDANKDTLGGMPFEQLKESIQGFLLQQKRVEIINSHVSKLGEGVDLQINSDWVKSQYALERDNPVDKARMSGIPTMVEFGATGCIPCDMMQPILNNLRKKYQGRLNVVFVHVREEQVLGVRFGIRSIPVQVFFDGSGEEVFRHEGFFPEEKITEVPSQMGVI